MKFQKECNIQFVYTVIHENKKKQKVIYYVEDIQKKQIKTPIL
jgi:hypothetical protein